MAPFRSRSCSLITWSRIAFKGHSNILMRVLGDSVWSVNINRPRKAKYIDLLTKKGVISRPWLLSILYTPSRKRSSRLYLYVRSYKRSLLRSLDSLNYTMIKEGWVYLNATSTAALSIDFNDVIFVDANSSRFVKVANLHQASLLICLRIWILLIGFFISLSFILVDSDIISR